MKHLLLAILSVVSGLSFGQIMISLDSDPSTPVNGQTLDVTVDQSNYTVKMHVYNESGGAMDVLFRRVHLTTSGSFTDQFCDNTTCYNTSGSDWTSPTVQPIADTDSTLMKPQLNFPGGSMAVIRYYVLDPNNGNAKLDSVDLNINSVVSVDNYADIKLSAYPNPANEELFVEFEGISGAEYQLALYNILGEEVKKIKLTNGFNRISVNDLTSGVYFYSVLNRSDIIETKKIIIRH